MKRVINLVLTTIILTSSFAFANAPTNVDGTIGKLETNQPLAEFVVDMTKLKDVLSKQKTPSPVQKMGRLARTATIQPVEKELKIINANDLPTNNVEQGRADELYLKGHSNPVPKNQVEGKSVTITKKALMDADLVVMQGALLKDFRVIGKAKDGGDIMAIDIMQLYSDDAVNEKPVATPYFATAMTKDEEGVYKRINGTNAVPNYGTNQLSHYTQGQPLQDVNVGQWYTLVWGNTLSAWTKGIKPYSMKDFSSLSITTNMQEELNEYGIKCFVPATNATQLIITELDK